MKEKRIQKISSYFAVFEPISSGGFNVSFPDFPGCITFGKDFDEARKMAADVLELWLEELKSRREKIPVRPKRSFIERVEVVVP